jgi:hypothetical protein
MAAMETCGNCDRPIGKLEQAFLWGDQVVCPQCHGLLSAGRPSIPYASPLPPPPPQVVYVMQQFNPGVAAVLSFILPGAGQIYKGQTFNGICWFIVVGIGYICLIIPGILLHICCILGAAAMPPPKKNVPYLR